MDYAQLKDLQSLPLKYKIMITKQRITEWYEHWNGMVYVSFSGGKDSTVLLRLARELYPEVPAVFVDTGLEYPEIRQFVKSIDNVVWLRPKMNFKQVLEKYGYPVISKRQAQYIREIQCPTEKNRATTKLRLTGVRSSGKYSGYSKISDCWQYLKDAPFKVSEQCCDVMKKKPMDKFVKETGRQPFIGTMASDGANRELEYLQNGGCNVFNSGRPKSTPLGFWTDQDVLQYLDAIYNPFYPSGPGKLPYHKPLYASVYGKIYKRGGQLVTTGVSRTGCMFCMFGVHMEQEPNRFQRMQITHPKRYNYCINGGKFTNGKWGPSKEGLGIGYVLKHIGVPYNNDNDGLWSTEELITMTD